MVKMCDFSIEWKSNGFVGLTTGETDFYRLNMDPLVFGNKIVFTGLVESGHVSRKEIRLFLTNIKPNATMNILLKYNDDEVIAFTVWSEVVDDIIDIRTSDLIHYKSVLYKN